MGGTQPSKELTMMQSLHELCRSQLMTDGGGWVLQSRYEELDTLVSANREEYLHSGGVAATVTLMLSLPNDPGVQRFCLGVLAKSRPNIAHISLAWKPIVLAVTAFPTDPDIQEHGTCLLLRGALAPELEEEALAIIATLRTAAKALFEGDAMGSPSESGGANSVPPGSSLCGEVLEALGRSEHRPAPLVELWYMTLSLTSHFVAAKDVPVILKQLRKVLTDKRSHRSILISCLATMRKMYAASQLHIYDEDLDLLRRVLGDYRSDLEVVILVLRVFRSIAHSPSIPNGAADMLADVGALASEGEDTEDILPEALDMLAEHVRFSPANLLTNPGEVRRVVSAAFTTSQETSTVRAAALLCDELLFSRRFTDTEIFSPAQLIEDMSQKVHLKVYREVLPTLMRWGVASTPGDGRGGLCVESRESIDAILQGIMAYISDESQRCTGRGSDGVAEAVGVLHVWASSLMDEGLHLRLVCLADALLTRAPGRYDRAIARTILEAKVDPAAGGTISSYLLSYFARVVALEATYWFPDRALRADIQKVASALPRQDLAELNLPPGFLDFVHPPQPA